MSAGAVANISPARAWILASRPATLPAAAVPVIVGAAAAVSEGARFNAGVFFITLLCALLIQVGTNFANDYSDFHRGADHEGRLGPVRVTQSGLITQIAVKRGIIVAFGLAVLLGIALVWIGGVPILLIGAASVIAGLAYTGGPFPFGYYGLGDVFVFVFFGLIAVSGTAYLQSGNWSTFPLLLSIPIGLIVTNILVVNNLRDLPTDVAAGKRTLATRIGDKATRTQYVLFLAISYAIPVAIALSDGRRRPLLLTLISLPLAFLLTKAVVSGTSGRELNPMLKKTGQLLLLYGVLLSAGALIGRAA
ncbi:MAG TPA: 1,4-dihydroxy-2-naphthoate polyprenyltransferase [Gemmatimonadaceae bacterium]